MNQEDATRLLIEWLREPNHGNYGSYGYDIFIPILIRVYIKNQNNMPNHKLDAKVKELCPIFFAAGWELCRRGVIRPGVNEYGAQATPEGNAGSGFSITPFGRKWLEEIDSDNYVPTEPGRFAEMLSLFRDRFGAGFYERAQEAVRCYGAHTYLACCAMCGAAAESIMLATAIAKQDEGVVLKVYTSANGRSKIENIVIGKTNEYLRKEYLGYTCLLKYWRDESAHGKYSGIGDNEAFTSLALLLRFAKFVDDNWDELTCK